MAKCIYVVTSSPVAGKEKEYNEWYNNIHLDDVLDVPGMLAAQRFKPVTGADNTLPGKYIALYEIDSSNPKAVIDGLNKASSSFRPTDAIDYVNFNVGVYEACSDQKVAKRR